jgi:pyridoxal phosphate enzyme (YggS family)
VSEIADRLAVIHANIAAAATRAGRSPDEVQLVAVSKTHPPEALQAACAAGQWLFGESRVQEARAKIPLLPGRAVWHFLGHLQKNKIRQALALGFDLFHGIDSLDLARQLDRLAGEAAAEVRILLEVNVAAESSKFGFSPERLAVELDELLSLHRLSIRGLMCLPPPVAKAEDARRYFVALRELRDRLQASHGPLPELSMGMSGDYPVAVEEGATLVRVGTALFGARSGKTWRPAGEGTDD